MRGIVMVIMLTDHASSAFNADRVTPDSAMFGDWTQPLDSVQFLFRWLSHLCAPVFLFLAGTSLALSIERRKARGVSGWTIDRDLLIRGLLILAVEAVFIDLFWGKGYFLLQVLFAIGASMLLMIGLRRLPSALLVVFAFASWIVGEWTRTGIIEVGGDALSVARATLLDVGVLPFGFYGHEVILALYPVLPWCGMMALGWVYGRFLLKRGEAAGGEVQAKSMIKPAAFAGVAFLALFAVVRGLNGFGNQGLLRVDGSLLQWSHVSKYPPSLSFVALELGIMFIVLAALFTFENLRGRISSFYNPILVFGQTAFFFYVAHIALLELSAELLDMHRSGTLQDTLIASALTLMALYPVCIGYRWIKARYPLSVLRFF